SWPDAAVNYLRSLNEGLADVHAVMRTGRPNFILPSLPIIGSDRDVSIQRSYTDDLRSQAEQLSYNGYNPYPLGTVVASAMNEIAGTFERARVAQLSIGAVRAMQATYGPRFRISDFLNLVVMQASAAEQPVVCGVFTQRFALVRTEITACP